MNSFDTEYFLSMSPKKSTIRRQYLLTYSKAKMTKFPTRETFAEAVVNSFTLSGKIKTPQRSIIICVSSYWDLRCGTLLKTTSCQNHQIVVNFSESQGTYYTAYVCRKDCNVIHSQNYPDL